PHAVPISARKGTGLDKLADTVSKALSQGFVDIDVETGVENGKLLAYLAAYGEVLSQRYSDSRVVIHCRISQRHLGRLPDSENAVIRPHTNGEVKNGAPLINGNGYVNG